MPDRACEYCRESTKLVGDCHRKMRVYRAACFCGSEHLVCAKCRRFLMAVRGILGNTSVALKRCPESGG